MSMTIYKYYVSSDIRNSTTRFPTSQYQQEDKRTLPEETEERVVVYIVFFLIIPSRGSYFKTNWLKAFQDNARKLWVWLKWRKVKKKVGAVNGYFGSGFPLIAGTPIWPPLAGGHLCLPSRLQSDSMIIQQEELSVVGDVSRAKSGLLVPRSFRTVATFSSSKIACWRRHF